jgi:hypothetical protein
MSLIKLLKHNDLIISNKYLEIQFCSFLRTYFNRLNKYDEIVNEVEEKLIPAIRMDFTQKQYYKERFEVCWKYADDIIFAGDSGVRFRPHEKKVRDRFFKNVVEPIRNL